MLPVSFCRIIMRRFRHLVFLSLQTCNLSNQYNTTFYIPNGAMGAFQNPYKTV
ncbi:hypothetical protein PF010_g18520 [Phytophthora fragariae]|uniref:Uncharacterized protein n=1 Tax=Phytophthora fragariae TaxID=53985 RepID=A0A6A4AUD0_9STRA|nr:hypothetical protein PF003_g4930 [Phytophthora fragariae]KAE8920595.1 hypothetical protein PF009_g29113 [Phytophthora fragariae]KAE9062467.1 hypothetical protein PF007_g29901 [Phytophthora fragariae]KAE9063592.1 hypothetical protein PF006_g30904 [Phytophthora fragariae]KAE9090606.1 hypothetical protein PF010_g18520 [Phytophthora fragariae]